MRYAVFLLALIAAFMAGSVSAQKPVKIPAPRIVGAGTRSCAQFAEDYRKYPAVVDGLYGSWAQGFITGMNFGLFTQNVGPKEPPPSNEIDATLRSQCDQHPLKAYWQVVSDYFFALPFSAH